MTVYNLGQRGGHNSMAWLVGIDEAGYGPNLGPLVMTVVACQVPDDARAACLWRLLRSGVRRHGARDDGRPVVADSKLVYSPTRGLDQLEKTVLAALGINISFVDDAAPPYCLESLLDHVSPDAFPDLAAEAWFTGKSQLPMECGKSTLAMARKLIRRACERAGVTAEFYCRSVIVCTPRFNDLTDTCDSKGAVLSHSLVRLLRACIQETAAEPMAVAIDKHGGRNYYAEMLGEAFAGGRVRSCEEAMERSVYEVEGTNRPVRVTVLPRADVEYFTVALASMVSKYLRESLMREFNAFWHGHQPGLKPTSGYPGDADRFYTEIRPAMAKLGLTDRQVWRRK
jgi:ribonuclease HII